MSEVKKIKATRGIELPGFALTDPALCLASIFRPIVKGKRPTGLNITSQHKGYKLQWTCFEWLDVRDQSMLFGVCGLAGITSNELNSQTEGIHQKQMWLDLAPTEIAVKDQTVYMKTNFINLIQSAGLESDSKHNYEAMKERLHRLSQLGCRATADGYDWSMKVLSWGSSPSGDLFLALNSRFARAIAGGASSNQSLIERAALRITKSGTKADGLPGLVHGYLNALVDPGKLTTTMLDSLIDTIYGFRSTAPSTHDCRRKDMFDALERINALAGWAINIRGRGTHAIITIERNRNRAIASIA